MWILKLFVQRHPDKNSDFLFEVVFIDYFQVAEVRPQKVTRFVCFAKVSMLSKQLKKLTISSFNHKSDTAAFIASLSYKPVYRFSIHRLVFLCRSL